jgi:hypothetical protein
LLEDPWDRTNKISYLVSSRFHIDGAEIIRQATVNNRGRIGSVNLDIANDFRDALALVKWMVANHRDVLKAAVRPIDGLDIEALAAALNDDTVIKPIMFPNGLVEGGFVS